MYSKSVFLFFISALAIKIESRFEFTNFVCKSYDPQFGEFEYCYLKSINRSYKYISGRFKPKSLPISKLKVNVALWKRFNGYKPFMYNITFDVCLFLNNRKPNPVIKFIHDSHSNFSNLNHSCPLNHDIILEKLPIDVVNHRFTNVLPFPEGDYLIRLYWLIAKNRTALAEIYGTLS
ncbi:uncharacterized protein LOC108104211 [Drosophila eugracilis]|uniref:uncharacterized protein LOC108104211 n=1 Tax=Drosophila eugracilis TaxID=29029 RepID=UPI001BDAD2E9|nr:uncharacterized protein LOC108104211 [Drosophila eugracilis]